jgi:peptide/nickel transport system permease protein
VSPWGRRRTPTPVEQAELDVTARGYEVGEPGSGDELAFERYDAGENFIGPGSAAVGTGVRVRGEVAEPGADLVPDLEEELASGALEEGAAAVLERPPPVWRQMLEVYAQNRLAVASTIVLAIIVLGCFIGPHFYVTNQTNSLTLTTPQNAPPSSQYWLGTDNVGWDVLGRIMYAGQYSLTLGFLAGLVTILVGTVYGMVSGYFGGALDAGLMRLVDAALAIPYLFLLIALVTIFHNSNTFLILVIGLTGWFGNARLIRGDALVIRDLEYSQAAVSMGARKLHIIRRHVFPNSISNIVTVSTFSIADAILALSALGFIAIGIQAPGVDWGTFMASGATVMQNGYWWELWPCAVVFVTVIVCINYMGDALRDIFEVRLRKR